MGFSEVNDINEVESEHSDFGDGDGVNEFDEIRGGNHHLARLIFHSRCSKLHAVSADGGFSAARGKPQRESGVANHILFAAFFGICRAQFVKCSQQVQSVI